MGKINLSIDEINKAIEEHGSQTKAARALGVSRDTIGRRLKDYKNSPPEKFSPIMERVCDLIYKNKKKLKEMSFQEFMEDFKQAQGFRNKLSYKQFEAEVEIPTNQPIAVTHFSDLHLGSPYTNYEAIKEDAELVAHNKHIYAMLGGDISDKMGTFKRADVASGQLHPANIQIVAEEKYIKFLENKIIAKIGGNHDTMDARRSGVDSTYFINRNKEYPYLPHGGLVRLKVGKVTYEILWKHTYRFNSQLNQFNAHHRMLEILYPNADIVVLEHTHNPGIESLEKGEFDKKTVVNIRTGAYKINDSFSMDFYKSGRTAPQTVILFPDEKKILAMHGRDAIKDAITYLRGYNGKKEKTKRR